MPYSRRSFIQHATLLGLLKKSRLLRAQQAMHHPMSPTASAPANAKPQATPMLHTLELTPFVDELPLPQRLLPTRGRVHVTMREIHHKVHRDVPPTRMWSYGDTALAPVIEARSGHPLQVEWINHLPREHFLPIDYTLHGCGRDLPQVRACVHLHGGKTPSKDDGQPDDWYIPGKSRVCSYPLQQEAATLWYHDHAMGLNRLNMYTGLVGMFLLRDDEEDRLQLPAGKYELPLTLYDRDFTKDGQLFYPVSPDPEKPWVSEFLADGILVNGKIRPYHLAEPRQYRIRLLNAANSRFFQLSFSLKGAPHTQPKVLSMVQIGTDQGLLASPHPVDSLTCAPGERLDLLVDLSPYAGQTVYLRNSAFEILELRVANTAPQPPTPLPKQLRVIPTPDPGSATVTRTITLNEYQDGVGNSMIMLLNRKHWHEPVTETPKLGATEIWEFVNQTEDTHPMHLHMVRFQVLDRRVFDTFDYMMHKKLRYISPPTPPGAHESGWKDVVQCTPGEITRILVHFDGFAGRYLYHCHILEHEANDMMRPFDVIA